MPILLKCKADEIEASTVPLPPQSSLPPQPSPPPPVAKCPRHNWELVSQMRRLLRTGAQQLDTDGLPRGLRCYGIGDAQAAGGDEGGFGLGIRGGRCDEGDVKVGG